METWIVIGAIWMMWVLFLVFFVRGASPTVSRALRRATGGPGARAWR